MNSERACLGLLLIFLGFSSVHAQPQGRGRVLPVEEMVRNADVAGVGTVQTSSSRLEPRNGLVVTEFRVSFSEVWKGDPGREFTLVKAGGEIAGRKTTLPGHEFVLKPGETIVVFASPHPLGNHNVIGMHQGLYRVGPGADQPLYRVSDYPQGVGSSSKLSLKALKDEVWRALGRPVESSPAPSKPSPGERSLQNGAVPQAPTAAPAAQSPVPTTPERSRTWLGGLFLVIVVSIGITVLLLRKKQARRA